MVPRRPSRSAASAGRQRPTRKLESPLIARLAGGDLPYTLRRSSRSKRLRVTVDPLTGVVASVPIRMAEARARALAESFLAEREGWLRRHLGRYAAGLAALGTGGSGDGAVVPYLGVPHRVRIIAGVGRGRRSHVERVGGDHEDELAVTLAPGERREPRAVLEAWFRARARIAVDAAVSRHAAKLGVLPAAIAIRDPRTRWGSASRHGRLMLAWRLVLAPPEVLETVVVHELCHLRVFGHGRGFWDLVAGRIPDHARHRRWLRDHAAALHAALSAPA